MKNQYFGDVGDYGKYGLLRFISGRGVKIAVNWYLTEKDETNHGNIRNYLDREGYCKYDRELFAKLKEMDDHKEQDVSLCQVRNIIPNAVYFDCHVKPLTKDSTLTLIEKREVREQWHQEALAVCDGAELVFLDPDNGLRAGKPSARKDAMKYVYSEEAADYYGRGQDVVYYCHKGRRKDAQWDKAKRIMQIECPDAVLMGVTFHRGTQRSYIFVVHPEREKLYRDMLRDFLETAWKDCFTDEFAEK